MRPGSLHILERVLEGGGLDEQIPRGDRARRRCHGAARPTRRRDPQRPFARSTVLGGNLSGAFGPADLAHPLLEPDQTSGYYHVTTTQGQKGWVWGRNVKAAPAGPTVALESVATSFDPTWEKPAPQETQFNGDEGACGPTGDGGDTETNRRKNRGDTPTAYHRASFAALAGLQYPVAGKERSSWTAPQLAIIARCICLAR